MTRSGWDGQDPLKNATRAKGGCLVWKGPFDGDGYGRYVYYGGSSRAAHLVSYGNDVENWAGRLRNRCGNRACIRPAHWVEESEMDWRDRYWAKVVPGSETECWPWTGARTRAGYGVLHLDYGQLQRGTVTRYAHRLAWELATGEQAIDSIGHTCGNRGCQNPNHLREDMQPNCNKLAEEEVLDIRWRCEGGESQASLAREYGVTPSMVSRIVNGTRRTWLDTMRYA